MNSENKHKWTLLPQKRESGMFKRQEHICDRCKCIRTKIVAYGTTTHLYERSGMIYQVRPDCFGSVPINDQGID